MNHGNDIRIGLVGCGHRAIVGFLRSLKEIGRARHVVALCDPNPQRLNYAAAFLGEPECRKCGDIDELLECPGLTTVIVAVPDYLHKDIVLRAFARGKDVVCEKPMATTIEDCRAMLEARGERQLRMAFNFRHHALSRKVKELIASGTVGRVLHVDMADIVSWQHGADYFRRWHRLKDRSGGLLVHKSVHSFDAVNWWLADRPRTVLGQSAKLFYLPHKQKGERCSSCAASTECGFYVDLTRDLPGQVAGIEGFYRQMYLEAEPYDGYIRDTCVFHRDNTVHDTYHTLVRYRGGALLTYSAVFYAPFEDRRGSIQGDAGRIDFSRAKGEVRVTAGPGGGCDALHRIFSDTAGHADADVSLMRSLFEPEQGVCAEATAEDGYWAVAVAAGANEAIAKGREVTLPDPGDGDPDAVASTVGREVAERLP